MNLYIPTKYMYSEITEETFAIYPLYAEFNINVINTYNSGTTKKVYFLR